MGGERTILGTSRQFIDAVISPSRPDQCGIGEGLRRAQTVRTHITLDFSPCCQVGTAKDAVGCTRFGGERHAAGTSDRIDSGTRDLKKHTWRRGRVDRDFANLRAVARPVGIDDPNDLTKLEF